MSRLKFSLLLLKLTLHKKLLAIKVSGCVFQHVVLLVQLRLGLLDDLKGSLEAFVLSDASFELRLPLS